MTTQKPLDLSSSTTVKELTAFAQTFGFEYLGSTTPSHLEVRSEVRDMCAADRCHSYDKNWTCPPACGTLEDFSNQIASKQLVLVVQTFMPLADEFDIEGMEEAVTLHKKRFSTYADAVKKAYRENPSLYPESPLFLSAGPCEVCPTCSYPDAPCRFPDKALTSMEAAGLVVSEVCTAADIPYYHGKNTISYTGCVLF